MPCSWGVPGGHDLEKWDPTGGRRGEDERRANRVYIPFGESAIYLAQPFGISNEFVRDG
jgi:hypothetical protein